MFDLMFKATDEASWDAYVAGLDPEVQANILLDEIGPIVVTPAVYDEDGDIVTPAVIDEAWHVNLRTLSDTVDCAALAAGNDDVEWIDPTLVSVPDRIWAGGMNYWVAPVPPPPQVTAPSTKK